MHAGAETTARSAHAQMQRPLSGLHMRKCRGHCQACKCANAEATVRSTHAQMQRPLPSLHMSECRGHCQVRTFANAEATARSTHSHMESQSKRQPHLHLPDAEAVPGAYTKRIFSVDEYITVHVFTASSYIYESDLFLSLFTGLSLLICLFA